MSVSWSRRRRTVWTNIKYIYIESSTMVSMMVARTMMKYGLFHSMTCGKCHHYVPFCHFRIGFTCMVLLLLMTTILLLISHSYSIGKHVDSLMRTKLSEHCNNMIHPLFVPLLSSSSSIHILHSSRRSHDHDFFHCVNDHEPFDTEPEHQHPLEPQRHDAQHAVNHNMNGLHMSLPYGWCSYVTIKYRWEKLVYLNILKSKEVSLLSILQNPWVKTHCDDVSRRYPQSQWDAGTLTWARRCLTF
jgi:hypothetical protein